MSDTDSALQPETQTERRLMALLLCIASGENVILLQANLFRLGAHTSRKQSVLEENNVLGNCEGLHAGPRGRDRDLLLASEVE
jgi:hypothetical protein